MNKMSLSSRFIIALASLCLITTFFVPVWFIFLIAPQYPEGLTMNIWLNRISGQVDIINGLNHYIGMKHIRAEMFPEFTYLRYVVGFFILFGLIVAFTGKQRLLLAYLLTTLAGGVAAMVDFYNWGYDYGHHLDPKAAIQIPGLSYQPPLFGHKTLLNFDAYSYPAAGGWVVVGVASLFFLVWIRERYRARSRRFPLTLPLKWAAPVTVLLAILLSSCQAKPAAFVLGKDLCSDCRMTIMDARFGGELITKKGKIYKFDDPHCLTHFIKSGSIRESDISQTVFVSYRHPDTFLNSETVHFVVGDSFKSPMNSNAAAFQDLKEAEDAAVAARANIKSWKELYHSL